MVHPLVHCYNLLAILRSQHAIIFYCILHLLHSLLSCPASSSSASFLLLEEPQKNAAQASLVPLFCRLSFRCFPPDLWMRPVNFLIVRNGCISSLITSTPMGQSPYSLSAFYAIVFFFLRSPVYTLQLSQKSDFQPSTIKSDNIGHPTVKTGQICPLGWF